MLCNACKRTQGTYPKEKGFAPVFLAMAAVRTVARIPYTYDCCDWFQSHLFLTKKFAKQNFSRNGFMKFGPGLENAPGPNFIKLFSSKYCWTNFAPEHKNEWGTSHNSVNFMVTCFLLSKIVMYLAGFCAYRLYEIGPWACLSKK